MPDAQPFVIRANTALRVFGLLVVLAYGWTVAYVALPANSLHEGLFWFETVVWLPLGTLLMLGVSQIAVDPVAETLVRRHGILPFAKTSARTFADVEEIVEEIVEDTVVRRTGRAKVPRDYNRLRLVFGDGEDWELLVEYHTGTKVHELAERLSTLTDCPLSSG